MHTSLSQIQYVRLWIDGFAEADTVEISIATLEIVSNEWEAVRLIDPVTQVDYEPVSIEVINTYDNPNYKGPSGVAGERDRITDIISQEQSLVLKGNVIADSSEGVAVRLLYENMDFLEYRKLNKSPFRGKAIRKPDRSLAHLYNCLQIKEL